MPMNPVKSTNIHALGFDGGKLQVQFLRPGQDEDGRRCMVPGDCYEYDDVPEDIYLDLMASPSVGADFALKVRKGGFKYRKLEPSSS